MTPSLRQLVDAQLDRLARVHFRPDPVLGSNAFLASFLQSAVKRHGPLIEAAITEALERSGDYQIARNVRYVLPAAAEHFARSSTPDDCRGALLPYGASGKVLRVDLIAFQRSTKRLGAYEIKRANGTHDAGKLRSLRPEIYGVQATLAGYGRAHGMLAGEAVSRVICYYGKRSLPRPWSIVDAELDQHFGCRVRAGVTEMTAYLAARVTDFVAGLDDLRPEVRQMALVLP
jgi:hypothetical protein